ncbi:hypothetical protein GGR51DRAFT_575207 [Nemania sp. FL0031]|nr:hypothetical protein GGR51DRAFT_575207 [Nemania sp. FL0031]
MPAVPSSQETVYRGSSGSLASTAVSIQSILRRAKSMCYTGNATQVDEGEEEEDRRAKRGPKSFVRANSKRRRSSAPIARSSSEANYGTNSSLARLGSVELVSFNHRDAPIPPTPRASTKSTPTPAQRSPSRGRTRRRDDTPYSSNPWGVRYSQDSRRWQYAEGGMTPTGQAEYLASSNADGFIDGALPYIRRGVYRLSKPREPKEFRFPKSKSQPELFWKAGDGFSDDELLPDFVLLMAGKNKRKRSRSLSTLGQLSVEAGNDANSNRTEVTISQASQAYGLRQKTHHVPVQEVWPTRENFTENSVAKKPKAKDHRSTQSSFPASPKPSLMSRKDMVEVIPRKRRPSDFENFGKCKRRSQSRHTLHQSLPFTTASQERGYQSSEDEYYEEDDDDDDDGLHRRAGYESESEQGGSNIGSVELGEPVDLDEDSQSYEVDSNPVHFTDTARHTPSPLGAGIYNI